MKKTKEIWVPAVYIRENGAILNFKDLYEVSSLGKVRSLRFGKTKILSQCTYESASGAIYYMVTLRKDNKRYTLQTHRLVLSSFKKHEHFEGAVCDHIIARSETECCNHLDNLRWVTQQQNVSTEHCKDLLSKTHINHPAKSKRVCVTDLTTCEVTVYPSAREAGRALGINPRTPAVRINYHNGFYKKMNLMFSYIE